MTTRRDLLVDAWLVVLVVLVNITLSLLSARLLPSLLAAVGLVIVLRVFRSDLRRWDDQQYGLFDLLICCDHTPEGIHFTQQTRTELWRVLRRLDPDHYLVWINRQPFDADRWHELRGSRR